MNNNNLLLRFSAFCIFLLLFTQGNSQKVEWEEMTPHFNDYPRAIFVTSDDRIIGWSEAAQSLYITSDVEGPWDFLSEIEENFNLFVDPILAENEDGKLFLASSGRFYSINEATQALDLIFSGIDIKGIQFMENGNVAFQGTSDISVYSLDDGFQYETQLDSGNNFFLSGLSRGPGNKYYIFIFDNLIVLDSMLSMEIERHPSYRQTTEHLLYDEELNRLYTEYGFSDDGMNWSNYVGNRIGQPLLSPNGDLHITVSEVLTTFADGGETMVERCTVSLENERLGGFFAYGEEGIIFNNHYSPNGCDNWMDISVELIGKSYASGVVAFSRNEVAATGNFCDDCDEFMYVSSDREWFVSGERCELQARDLFWKDFLFDDDGDFYFNGCQSRDGGENWIEFVDPSPQSYQANVSGLYAFAGANKNLLVYKSEDSGDIWSQSPIENDFSIHDMTVVTNSGTVYSLESSSFTSGSFIKSTTLFNELGDTITGSNSNFHIEAIRASFGNNKIYILESDFGEFNLGVYNEDSQTLTYNEVPRDFDSKLFVNSIMLVDNQDNVYLQDESHIWVTQDDGKTWCEITPNINGIVELTGMDISWDNYLFVSTIGTPIIRSRLPVVPPSSTDDIELTEISIFPNPADYELVLEIEDSNTAYNYELTNSNGSMVSTGRISSSKTISLLDIPSGLYFVAIKENERLVGIEKVVIK